MIHIHPTATSCDAIQALQHATGLRAQVGKTYGVLVQHKPPITLSFSNLNPADLGLPNIFAGAK